MTDDDADREPIEFELKLCGSREALQEAFDRMAAGSGPVVSSKLATAYYDTPDDNLARRGLSLRVRKAGRKREMTLKAGEARGLGRSEWSVPVNGGAPDPALLPPKARERLGDVEPGQLIQRHGAEVARRTKLVERGGSAIEIALDFGRLTASGRDQPLAELELELKRGGPGPLFELADELLAALPLGLSARSKAERGLELATGAGPAAVKAGQADYPADASVEAALAAFCRAAAIHAAGNIAAIAEAGDPEGVHQMRVALRRLRSAFGLFSKDLSPPAREVDAMAKSVLKALGEARDLDVFCDETLPPLLAGAPEARMEEMEALAAMAESSRREARAAARRLAGGPALARLVVALHALAEDGPLLEADADDPVADIAPPLLDKRLRKALKRGKAYARLGWEDRHKVRIAVKKLRYALDFFASLHGGKQSRAFARRMSRLQDDMGAANDAHVAQELAAKIAAGDILAMRGAAFVAGWQARALGEGEKELVAAWKAFRRQKPFWR